MQKFERPDFAVEEYVEDENYGKFVLSPLERGFGTTIGNALRRVLLSSLPGAAVYSIKVDNVYHEFTSIPGVREDVSMIILQLKKLIMTIEDDEVYTLQISAKGSKTVTAGDIICPAQVEILNKDLEIAHVEKGGNLEMEIKVKNGRGYVSSDINKHIHQGSSVSIGTVFTDSIYTPIEKVTYHDSCHMKRGLGVFEEPRALLNATPGVELVEMKNCDKCCGMAGSFGMKYSEVSIPMLEEKVQNIKDTGATTCVVACPSCMMQIGGGLDNQNTGIKVKHIADVLAEKL